jgi:hypothetical protein
VTLTATGPLWQKLTFSAMATLGLTAADEITQASLIGSASASRTGDWGLGLAQKEVFREGDSIGLTVAVPWKTLSGFKPVSTAGMQSQSDSAFQNAAPYAILQPTGIEKDVELAYATPMRFGGNLTAMALVKLQPGHDAQAAAQFSLGLRYRHWLK